MAEEEDPFYIRPPTRNGDIPPPDEDIRLTREKAKEVLI